MTRVSLLSLSKRLDELEKYKSPDELKKRMKELSEAVESYMSDYNSPEAKAEREAKYQELQKIGDLRRQAYQRGEDLRKYPLPWETVEGLERQIKENQEAISFFTDLGVTDNDNLLEVDRRLRQQLQERKAFEESQTPSNTTTQPTNTTM